MFRKGFPRVSAALGFLLALTFFPHLARAQYDNTADVFVGFSYLRLVPGAELDSVDMVGWDAAVTGYPFEWLGFTADFANHYGSLSSVQAATDIDVNQFSFLFGPRLRLLRQERFSAAIVALVGVSRGKVDADVRDLDGTAFGASAKQTKFAGSFGGAIDVNVSERVAVRLEPTYFLTSFGGERQNNFRFSVGVLYRFGERW